MNKKKKLNWDLRFVSKELESEYSNSKHKYQKFFLNILILYGFLVGFVGWLINPFKRPDHFEGKMLILRLSLLIILPVLLFLGHKYPQQREKLIVVIVLSYFFSLMEGSAANRTYWNNIMFFITGSQLEFSNFPLMLGKISWKTSCIISTVFRLLCAFRYTEFDENLKMNFYPIVQFSQNIIVLGLAAFFVEKMDRESFQKIKTYENSLSCYKDLITDIFPSAIIILKGEKIAFHNNEALALLECSNQEEIYSCLEKLKFHEGIDLPFERKSEFLETDEIKPINKRLITLENINFKQMPVKKTILINSKTKNQKSYCGVFDIGEGQKSLEIKTTSIIWEDEKAFMIIVSESKVVQKMKLINEQSQYKDRLLATVSHDLRTPLNGIIGMIRMASELNQDEDSKKYLSIALRSSYLLLMMINDILDYSQISNGKLRLSFDKFNMWNLIKDVSKLFKFQAKLKGVKFEKENMLVGNNEADYVIKSDQNRLKQVLFNLLGNALKFTVKGQIKIRLSRLVPLSSSESNFYRSFDSSRGFIISVEDTGIGIKEEDQQHLFKLFGKLQNENTNKLNNSGVGLGLAISQSLVRILNNNRENAEIKVKSEYGKGSCFSFVLYSNGSDDIKEEFLPSNLIERSEMEIKENSRVLEREIDSKHKIPPPTDQVNVLNRKKHLLVVDDDQINILVISSYLKNMSDIEFDVACNGEEAINFVNSKAEQCYYYDVILMDCNMPRMNGFEASKIIKEMIGAGEIPRLVIIACTANASPKDYELCFENGMEDHITKPFSKEEMRKKIDKFI